MNTACSTKHQEPSASHEEKGEHTSGKHDGAGKDGGQGLGMGKNAQVGALQPPSVQNVLLTAATYVSITAVFAFLIVVLEKLLYLFNHQL